MGKLYSLESWADAAEGQRSSAIRFSSRRVTIIYPTNERLGIAKVSKVQKRRDSGNLKHNIAKFRFPYESIDVREQTNEHLMIIPFYECYFSSRNERENVSRRLKEKKSMKDRRISRSLSGERKNNNNKG